MYESSSACAPCVSERKHTWAQNGVSSCAGARRFFIFERKARALAHLQVRLAAERRRIRPPHAARSVPRPRHVPPARKGRANRSNHLCIVGAERRRRGGGRPSRRPRRALLPAPADEAWALQAGRGCRASCCGLSRVVVAAARERSVHPRSGRVVLCLQLPRERKRGVHIIIIRVLALVRTRVGVRLRLRGRAAGGPLRVLRKRRQPGRGRGLAG